MRVGHYGVYYFPRDRGYELKLWRVDIASALAPGHTPTIRGTLTACREYMRTIERQAGERNERMKRHNATNPDSGIIEILRAFPK